MSYKVAIASTDGKFVNQHFGRAQNFHVIEIENDEYSYVESRKVVPCCHMGEHEEDGFCAVLNVLSDVQAIIVSKIGEGASAFLESRGLTVYEAPYPIVPLMEKIVKERLYEVDQWQFPTTN